MWPEVYITSSEKPCPVQRVLMEMGGVCAAQYGGHQPRVATEHLKCGDVTEELNL